MRSLLVAVGVVVNAEGHILIAQRAGHRHQGGLWEFPGGKVEAGETPRDALARELEEEVGIVVLAAEPLLNVQHDYPDRSVTLDVFRVHRFRGEAQAREGQPLRWVAASALEAYAFPQANRAIVEALVSG